MGEHMSSISNDHLSELVIARRLMITAQELEARRHGKHVTQKSAKEIMEEDQALLSGETPETARAEKTSAYDGNSGQAEETDIRLSDLIGKLHQDQGGNNSPAAQIQAAEVEYTRTEEVELSLRYTSLERVDGLVVRSKNLAETDRYSLEFQDGMTFRIVDKYSGRATRIWGDPHVDVDDVEGDREGEFSDFKGSDSHTTLALQDGTRVTFTAKDNGVIERVDIFKNNQHLGGLGSASKEFNEETGLFAASVDTSTSGASVSAGDTVYAGGDGNDWYDSAQRLVWGKTTGPLASTRPSALLELSYRRTVTESFSASVTFGTQA
jgi:hypothetical protein